MAKIAGEIVISRPAEAVFDFAADQRNEPRYNPRMIRADKVSDGPVGKGTVFRCAARSMGRTAEMRIELTGYDRPGRLASRTTTGQVDIDGTLTFDRVPGGTRMRRTWIVRPRGGARVLAPVITWIGRRQEQAIWTSMKRYLETPAATVMTVPMEN
jgi:polyketide cyclase/dehydrase/lipid transport protein